MTREEAIVDIRDNIKPVVGGKSLDMAIKALEQEPKTGHWIYIGQSEVNGLKICKCSKCGKRTYGSLDYCGNCGARMVEPQERSDKE